MRGADQCPRCGSDYTADFTMDSGVVRGCVACHTLWEPFAVGDLTVHLDPHSPFRAMCDNCAFRPGSPERQDAEKWDCLMQKLMLQGHHFYCHKGVPLVEDGADRQTHDHPRCADGRPDPSRMRLCAGYLAHKLHRAAHPKKETEL